MPAERRRVDDLRTALWHLRRGGPSQLRTWRRRRAVSAHQPTGAFARRADGSLDVAAWPLPERAPRRPDLRVGVILDDFSRLALGFEWEQVELVPGRWRDQVEQTPLDLLFVESAWHGNGDAWQYALTGSSAPRPELVRARRWCREHGIPTVFWNKEDPLHFDDFLDTARLFDHVLHHRRRTPRALPPRPRSRPGRGHGLRRAAGDPQPGAAGRVGTRPATSPSAGMYFAHKYPERRAQMDLLLGAASDVSPRMPSAWRSTPATSAATTATSSRSRSGRGSSGRSTTRRC